MWFPETFNHSTAVIRFINAEKGSKEKGFCHHWYGACSFFCKYESNHKNVLAIHSHRTGSIEMSNKNAPQSMNISHAQMDENIFVKALSIFHYDAFLFLIFDGDLNGNDWLLLRENFRSFPHTSFINMNKRIRWRHWASYQRRFRISVLMMWKKKLPKKPFKETRQEKNLNGIKSFPSTKMVEKFYLEFYSGGVSWMKNEEGTFFFSSLCAFGELNEHLNRLRAWSIKGISKTLRIFMQIFESFHFDFFSSILANES